MPKSKQQKQREEHWACLMRKAQAGDSSSYHQLLGELNRVAVAFLSPRLSDPSFVDDICQEMLISVDRARHTWNPTKAFSPWFFSILKRRFIDHLRKQTRYSKRFQVTDLLDWSNKGSSKETGSELDLALDFETLIRKLPKKQQEAFKLVKVEGLSIAETSKKTGMSESAIKVSIHRAKKTLYKQLVE